MSLTMEAVLDRLQTIQGKPPAHQSPEVRLTIVTCRHCGARYWHHLGHMAEGGKITGGPCCFGHPVLTVSKYPTEAEAAEAYPWPESAGEPEHGSCYQCGEDTRCMLTRPDGSWDWQCIPCFDRGATPLPDTQKAVTGEMVKPI